MNKKVIPLIVQLKQNNNYIVQGINQNDAGVILDIKIMDGLEDFNYAGYAVVILKIMKPDGTYTYDSNTGAYVDIVDPTTGRLKVNIPTSCTAMNGMHFCTVGFGYDEETIFDSMSFNYFVGDNPNASDDDVIGTNEFPILTNLVAEISGAVTEEEGRKFAEAERVNAEEERQASYENMMSTLQTKLEQVEDALEDANNMLNSVYQAIAQGGSIDIDTINGLATKTYVSNYVRFLNFGYNASTGVKDTRLQIYRFADAQMPTLAVGEFGYAPDTHNLYIGNNGSDGNTLINEPCFIASETTPDDTTKLWIDTSGSSPVINYYNGTTWVSCNTAVFA